MYCELYNQTAQQWLWADGEDMLCLDDLFLVLGLDQDDRETSLLWLVTHDMEPIIVPGNSIGRDLESLWVLWGQIRDFARWLRERSPKLQSQEGDIPEIIWRDQRFNQKMIISRNADRKWKPVRSHSI